MRLNSICGSVDTLDCSPPPALPPRRPPWPPNSQLSTATLRNIGAVTGLSGGGGGGEGAFSAISTSNNISGSLAALSPIPPRTTSGKIENRIQGVKCHQTPPPPPSLAPPQYPAPPRPPSRNGGDETRIARAGSCRIRDTTSPNGTSSRGLLPPRAGWPVRSTAATSSTSSNCSSTPTTWDERVPLSPTTSIRSFSGTPSALSNVTETQSSLSTSLLSSSALTTPTLAHRQQHHQQQHLATTVVPGRWPDRLELRGGSNIIIPMSNNNFNIQQSRPPSSASSGSSTSNLARVHGHDHTRPLPPPRLTETPPLISTIAPLTAPLTPLSTSSSFRINSRIPLTNSLNDTSVLSTSRNTEQSRTTPNVGEVTLTVPRPDGDRIVNEYVETPFRQVTTPISHINQKCLKNERRHHHHHHHHNHHQQQHQQQQQQHHHQQQQQQQQQQNHQQHQQQQLRQQHKDERTQNPQRHQTHLLQSSLPSSQQPITKQPVSFTKEPAANALSSANLGGIVRPNDTSLSIMCEFCGRCKCESCREPPPLPSRWLCNNSCFCSAETALDYASCLCCVKGLFYHCADSGSGVGDTEGGGSCADEPCSCSGSRRTARWACLAALTMVLPCLMCYWPLKGCVAVCEACYARHAAQGCRCDPSVIGGINTGGSGSGVGSGGRQQHHSGTQSSLLVSRDSRDPEKRLLDPVTPEL